MPRKLKMRRVQSKLVKTLLLSSTFPLIAIATITIIFLSQIAVDDASKRLSHYLAMAEHILTDAGENLRYVVRDQNRRIYTRLESGDAQMLRNELKAIVKKNNLDFFYITDMRGNAIINVTNPQAEGVNLLSNPEVSKALLGEMMVSTEIIEEAELKRLGLLQRAQIPGVKKTEALVLKAVLPVIDREEKIVGTMNAGYLFNNSNKVVVNEIKRTTGLFSSIFLRYVRISSNIPSREGGKGAVGSELGLQEVERAIAKGTSYIGRMPILREWYMSAYAPIYNSKREFVGVMGVNIPEANIFALRNYLISVFAFAVFLSILIAFIFGLLNGGKIVGAIEELKRGTEAVSRGDFLHKIRIKSDDEIEELANFFNRMTQELKIDREQIEEYSIGLESKVKEKTSQLESAHKKLVEYEKMAAMGRMATTLGHELRNVFAGIRTVTYNLKSKIAEAYPNLLNPVKDLEYEVNYGNEILDNVLRFSLPKKLILSEADINLIIEEIVSSLNLEQVFKNIEVVKDLDSSLAKLKADSVQIREVVLNVIINAVQAMPSGGKLSISSITKGEFLKVRISDTGSGIAKGALDNLFVPFFTTKSRGLGLGLFISKEIIKAHKGTIEVETELGKGSTFTISLPFKNTESA